MAKEIIIALGLIAGYLLYRAVNMSINKAVSKKQKSPTNTHSDILTNDKYKVKSQWDK